MAGISQIEAAKYLIDGMQHISPGCQGVIFFQASTATGKGYAARMLEGWTVMDRQKHCMLKARSPIKEGHGFVIFDEARCRSASKVSLALCIPRKEFLEFANLHGTYSYLKNQK